MLFVHRELSRLDVGFRHLGEVELDMANRVMKSRAKIRRRGAREAGTRAR
jgi:hypothetical protein